MYGKGTVLRLAEESTWGQAPSGGWVEAACREAKASLSGRAGAFAGPEGAETGLCYAVANFDVLPDTGNVEELASAALGRDGDGEVGTYSVEVADASGAWMVSGGAVRRLKIRAGIARGRLEFAYEVVGRTFGDSVGFAGGAGGRPFSFAGATALVDLEEVAVKEFSISVNNNLFTGPADDEGLPGFLTAGRQDVTGYICVAGDRRDLVDTLSHELRVALPGEESEAVVAVDEVIFTWCREIRSLSSGVLQVLYLEGASGAITGGVGVSLSV